MKYAVEACIAPGERKLVSIFYTRSPRAAIKSARKFHKGKGYSQFWAYPADSNKLTDLYKETGLIAAIKS